MGHKDSQRIGALSLSRLNKIFTILLGIFVVFSVLDVFSTSLGMRILSSFHERNQLAASIFDMSPGGFFIAVILLKVVPSVVLVYMLLLKDSVKISRYEVRAVKLAGIIALAFVDLFFGYVLAFHNFPALLGFS